MRKLTIMVILLICGFLAYDLPAYGQNKSRSGLWVYVVAVKGDCNPDQPVAIYNGRAVPLPAQVVKASGEKKQAALRRFGADEKVKEIVEKEFKKNRPFRVASSPAEADIVFHVCSSYWEELGSKIIMSGKLILPTHRTAAYAYAIPAPIYQQQNGPSQDLFKYALWKADTINSPPTKKTKNKEKENPAETFLFQEVNYGARIIFSDDFTSDMLIEASPLELAHRFIKEPLALRKKFATLSRLRFEIGDVEPDKRLPKLKPYRSGIGPGAVQPVADGNGDEIETVKIDTSLVVVPVSVMDKDGKYIPGLTERDFQVYEDRVQQEITEFGGSEAPFNIVLMLDISESTRFKLEEIQDAALTFIDQLRPQDKVMVVVFDKVVKVATEFTNKRDQLVLDIMGTGSAGATRLYDALDLVLIEKLGKIQGRKAIVVFTDGLDTASRLAKIEDVIDHVEESGALLYPVFYDTYEDTRLPADVAAQIPVIANTKSMKNYEVGIKFLLDLATRSGGRYYVVANIRDTKKAFAGIVDELRKQYWLGYYSTNSTRDGKFRRIRVMVDRPGIAIRARQGYRAQSENKSPQPQKSSRPSFQNNKP
ncbi:MAG: VWA domain-containing protein [Acidobacteria bacterium]|nr:VWA domain-containing protein [Acidobacteriota bacterium]